MDPKGLPRKAAWRKVLLFVLLQLALAAIIFAYVRTESKLGASSLSPAPAMRSWSGNRPLPYLGSSGLTILLWTWPYGIRVGIENCTKALGVPDCRFTADRSWYRKADAVLVHHYDVYRDASKLPREPRPASQRWIWYSPEPPSKHPVPTFMDNLFNLTMSYRRDSDIYTPYGWLEPLDQPQEFAIPAKSKLVAWAVSNWQPSYVQPRIKYYEELKKHIQVDVYGRGHTALPGSKLLPTLSRYKFYLAFENSQHDDYISEKVWRNAFLSGTVPVVMGPSRKNYERCLPPDSFIHIDDFPSPQALADFLREVDGNDTRYAGYFRWRSWLKPVHYPSWGYQFCKACRGLQRLPPMYQALPELSTWFR